jgi:hypothetical protein
VRAAVSKNGVLIRLPDERWVHITEEHSELAGHLFDVLETVEQPDSIYEGSLGALLAVRSFEAGKHLVVVYRGVSTADGFVITAFLTRRLGQIARRKKLWPQ